jgi:hypothetical protein
VDDDDDDDEEEEEEEEASNSSAAVEPSPSSLAVSSSEPRGVDDALRLPSPSPTPRRVAWVGVGGVTPTLAIASRSIACLRSAVEVGSLGREGDDDASGDVGGDSDSGASGGTAAAVRFAAVDALAPRSVCARVVRLGERGVAFERSETHGMGA